MKYLVVLVMFLAGCHLPTVTTECRHVVLAQKASALEQYPKEDVQIVTLQKGKTFHQQVRVKINGDWKWLKNSHMRYSFWNKHEKGYKIIGVK